MKIEWKTYEKKIYHYLTELIRVLNEWVMFLQAWRRACINVPHTNEYSAAVTWTGFGCVCESNRWAFCVISNSAHTSNAHRVKRTVLLFILSYERTTTSDGTNRKYLCIRFRSELSSHKHSTSASDTPKILKPNVIASLSFWQCTQTNARDSMGM